MDYVIFDLEWNQCPYGKGKENPKLPFEIIEIGAVKMDGERNVVAENLLIMMLLFICYFTIS